MTIRLVGVIFVVVSCGGVGFKLAANYKKEEQYLSNLAAILDFMISELQYRLTPLTQLCRQASQLFQNPIGNFFEKLSDELDMQQYSEPAECIDIVLENNSSIPPITKSQLMALRNSLGRFDIDGQMNGMEAVRQECERNLLLLRDNRENRLRSYQTLGLCAGAALAILLV